MKKITKKFIVILLIMLLGGLGGVIFDRYLFPYLSSSALFSKYKFLKKSTEEVTVINKTEQVYVKEESSINKIASQAASSVVGITSYPNQEATKSARVLPTPQIKTGTGIVATSDGIILTYLDAINVENSRYKVSASNGNSYDGELIGVDSYSNLAFIKINASNLTAVSFGNSSESQPGEKIVAIGNSLGGYNISFSSGLLSTFNSSYNLSGKTISSSEKMEGVFMTDLGYNNLYPGGPIVDYSGQTIGVVGLIQKDAQKEFFIIPSEKVKLVLEKAIKKELNQNPVLGIYFVSLNKNYSNVRNLPLEEGVLIYSPSSQQGLAVISGSVAEKAGLHIGDILTKINDDKITPIRTLPDILYKHKKGDVIRITILRGNQEIVKEISL